MKTTGVIRRIDELGRIVIPKEIRRTLRINDGENLEICLSNDSIVLSKFSSIKSISDLAQKMTDVLYTYLKKNIIITDTSNIIAASGNIKKNIINKQISLELNNSIRRREHLLEKYSKDLNITENFSVNSKYIIDSISSRGDVIGLIIVIDNNISEMDFKIINIVSDFIGKYVE